MTARKKSEIASLFLPVFLSADNAATQEISLSFNDISCGQLLYGDSSKARGLRLAVDWAAGHGNVLRVVDLRVAVKNATLFGARRMDRETLLATGYDMLRLEFAKVSLQDELALIIEKRGRHLFPMVSQPTQRSMSEWLLSYPITARVIFEEFPHLNTLIIPSQPFYSNEPLNVAVLKSREGILGASLIHNPDFRVNIS